MLEDLERRLTRHARGEELALLFIDLDRFKYVNDTLGHHIGDELLKQVSKALQARLREGDTLARLGGDEFIVLLEDIDSQYGASQVAEKLVQMFEQPFVVAGHELFVTCSVGISLFPDDATDLNMLIRNADVAMYQAKAAGRNAMRFFEPSMQEVVTIRATLDADLRLGLQHGQFRLYYQPQVDAAERVTGAEVLLRWLHPQRGLVHPLDFIAAAEESGLILPLGRWVMETACAQLAAWAAQPEMAHLTVAVNVSPLQFRQPDFVEQVNQVLVASGANPRRLKLELTETMLLDDVEQAICKMAALKVRGVNFALDDFGTGYSSLSYLQRLPISQLKIDRSFVRDILNSASDAAITR
eukprot:gene34644-biopygen21381